MNCKCGNELTHPAIYGNRCEDCFALNAEYRGMTGSLTRMSIEAAGLMPHFPSRNDSVSDGNPQSSSLQRGVIKDRGVI